MLQRNWTKLRGICKGNVYGLLGTDQPSSMISSLTLGRDAVVDCVKGVSDKTLTISDNNETAVLYNLVTTLD